MATEGLQDLDKKHRDLPAKIGAAILALATAVAVAEQRSIATVNGWWVDELFSLWATEPALSLAQDFAKRFRHDPTPPLYYVLLHCVRALVRLPTGHERTEVLALNIVFLVLAAATVLWASRRDGLPGFALAATAAFLLSGPVVAYLPEARAYILSMAIVFVASWFIALAIESPDRDLHPGWFILFGALAALSHFYAALMCGCLAAALFALGTLRQRRDLTRKALALGISVACIYAFWFALAGRIVMTKIRWIRLVPSSVFYSWSELAQFTAGGRVAVVVAALLLLFGLIYIPTRPLFQILCGALALFLFLPLLISLRNPIIAQGYWLIGAPAFVVLLMFLLHASVLGAIQSQHRIALSLVALTTLALLIASSVTGFQSAHRRTQSKWVWKGTAIVAPLLSQCPAQSVHLPQNKPQYAQAARAPEDTFLGADEPATPWLTPATASCPVLGWAEHLSPAPLARASDAELLRALKIDAQPSQVDIRRQQNGYIVLRRPPS